MDGSFFYLVGAALGILGIIALLGMIALFRGRRGGNSIKARDISGSIVINGDTSGPVVQSSSPAASGTGEKGPNKTGLIGVILSGAQLIVSLVK